MNKNEMFIDFDKDLKSTLKPRVTINIGGESLHFKRNANLIKSLSSFTKYQIGKMIADEDPNLPTDINERNQYVMDSIMDEGRYEMRLSFLNVMFSETFDDERMDRLMEFYQEEGLDLEDKDELTIWLLTKLTPKFMEVVVDTQKPKPSRKKEK